MVRTKTVQQTPSKPQMPISHGVGRRKKAIARVWLYRGGKGEIVVNDRPLINYFDTDIARHEASLPLRVTNLPAMNVAITVSGGGSTGQAGAIRVGLARALLAFDQELRSVLREHGLLTVDSRVKERKKYGQKAARRKFQFVKR